MTHAEAISNLTANDELEIALREAFFNPDKWAQLQERARTDVILAVKIAFYRSRMSGFGPAALTGDVRSLETDA